MMVAPSVTDLFVNNSADDVMVASQFLIKVAEKILTNPFDVSCRSILVGSSEVMSLLSIQGAIDSLFTMGFEEAGEYFTLPFESDIEQLRRTRNEIHQERNKFLRRKLVSATENFVNTYAHHGTENNIVGFVDSKFYPSNIKEQEKLFYSRLLMGYKKTVYYEDPVYQEKAKQSIPFSELNLAAEKAYSASLQTEKNLTNDKLRLDIRDFLLMELLHWFKGTFFHWIDRPPCDVCASETRACNGEVFPEEEEKLWDVGRVESYVCKSCGKQVRFPRFNNPLKLLETKRGRCGEWANCFTLLCRALQFEARFVEDWTDHVWTEVFSDSQQRWLHVDPCEGICDQPLIYENGWKKKISYVIAYGNEEVLDVTWRYSSKHKEVLARRLLCREQWLFEILRKMTGVCQSFQSSSRKKILLERKAMELVEFLCPRSPNDVENRGRSSGSLSWRLQRGETAGDETISEPFVFLLTPAEVQAKKFHLQYSSSEDVYVRKFSNTRQQGWKSGVFSSNNVLRKVENDWNMSYLARKEGTDAASIRWKFDFKNYGKKVSSINVLCQTTVFENGHIQWTLCGDDNSISFVPKDGTIFATDKLEGSTAFTLQADLNGGSGSCAWQHTQLFRQSLKGKDEFGFDLLVTFL